MSDSKRRRRRNRKRLSTGFHGFFSDSMGSIDVQYGTFRPEKVESTVDVLKNYWFAAGILQKPRLLGREWNSNTNNVERKFTSLNAFCDTLFSVIISSLGSELRAKQTIPTLFHYVQYIAITLSLWLSTAGYSSRFDNEDVQHKLFWSLYGVGVMGMLMHSTGDIESDNARYFSLCLAFVYATLAFQWIRSGVFLPRCRVYCTMQTAFMAFLSGIAYISYQEHILPRGLLFWILAVAYPIEIAFTVIWQEVAIHTLFKDLDYDDARREVDLPVHLQFHIDRFSTLTMMVLGQLAVAVSWHPEEGFGHIESLYIASGCAFISLVALKILIFDIDFLDPEDHAIRRARITGILWLLMYPAGMACIATLGSGIALLVAQAGAVNSVPAGSEAFRQWLTCGSMTVFLTIATVQRNLHKIPYVSKLREHGDFERALLVTRIHSAQCSLQMLAAIVFGVMPMCKVTCLNMLQLMAITLVLLIAVNLIDEIVLVQTMKAAARDRQGSFNRATPPRR
mmetsp:Transcript_16444/g.24779  ORF Transcript_16444/g.24779 Transcript_16444/m.24779 type:complete len:509 (-) Transcript_16444:143-1669(-)